MTVKRFYTKKIRDHNKTYVMRHEKGQEPQVNVIYLLVLTIHPLG